MTNRAQEIARLKAKVGAMKAAPQTIEVVAPPAKRPQELFLQIGKRRYQVASIEEAVAKYTVARNKSGLGASEMPRVTIVSATGTHLYGISYNGRVWDGDKPLDGMSSEEWVASVKAS